MAMAADHVAEGIRVNCVNPGTVDTPWVGRLLDQAADPAAERAALEARQPTGRLVTADEVAAAVLYLGGRAAGSTTGTALAVDGGMSGLRLRHAPIDHRGGDMRSSDLNHDAQFLTTLSVTSTTLSTTTSTPRLGGIS